MHHPNIDPAATDTDLLPEDYLSVHERMARDGLRIVGVDPAIALEPLASLPEKLDHAFGLLSGEVGMVTLYDGHFRIRVTKQTNRELLEQRIELAKRTGRFPDMLGPELEELSLYEMEIIEGENDAERINVLLEAEALASQR